MINTRTGLTMVEESGTYYISNDLTTYGTNATQDDLRTYWNYLSDHMPKAEVVFGERNNEFESDGDDTYGEINAKVSGYVEFSLWEKFGKYEAMYKD